MDLVVLEHVDAVIREATWGGEVLTKAQLRKRLKGHVAERLEGALQALVYLGRIYYDGRHVEWTYMDPKKAKALKEGRLIWTAPEPLTQDQERLAEALLVETLNDLENSTGDIVVHGGKKVQFVARRLKRRWSDLRLVHDILLRRATAKEVKWHLRELDDLWEKMRKNAEQAHTSPSRPVDRGKRGRSPR